MKKIKFQSSYEELFLKSGKTSINVQNYRYLCIETFKTVHDLNPDFMKDIFRLKISSRPTRDQYKLNLEIPDKNRVRFGSKSLRSLGAKIWNSLPYHIKSAENLMQFRKIIEKWNGTNSNCSICH